MKAPIEHQRLYRWQAKHPVPEVEPIESSLGVLTVTQLALMEPPDWHVYGVLPENALAALYGKWGVGKSFLALDWALCTAAGVPWQGRYVKQGSVLYIAAEGSNSLGKRVDAWCVARDLDLPAEFYTVPRAVNVSDQGQLEETARVLGAMPSPALIVVDTLARNLAGDENDAGDVGAFVRGADELARPYGATRLVVHHPGHDGSRMRGSSSLPGAIDTEVELAEQGDGLLRLRCEKQKDALEFAPIFMQLRPVAFSVVLGSVSEPHADDDLKQRVVECVRDNPGCSGAKVEKNVGGQRDAIRAALHDLTRSKEVVDKPDQKGETTYHHYHLA
jgi:AAA domain